MPRGGGPEALGSNRDSAGMVSDDYLSPHYIGGSLEKSNAFVKSFEIKSTTCIETQTEPEIFFAYILDLLRMLEAKINSGEIKAEHLLNADEKNMRILEAELLKSREKLKELAAILGRIGGLRNKGGDIFFKGLAKVFQTNPTIPPGLQSRLDILNQPKKVQNTSYPKHILDFRIKK
jgi:hypothetical protein